MGRWEPSVSGSKDSGSSADGDAWNYLPHDQARSRAYRWGDGLAGFSDIEQRLCLGLAVERARPDPQGAAVRADRPAGQPRRGRQGVLVVSRRHTPNAWNRWRYHYPQGAFRYEDLVETNGRRGKLDPGYELLDTGAFDSDRY